MHKPSTQAARYSAVALAVIAPFVFAHADSSAPAPMRAAQGPIVPAIAECAASRPEWIWCDDFETNRLASYFEYSNNGGRFVRASGVGVGNSFGMSARYGTAAP